LTPSGHEEWNCGPKRFGGGMLGMDGIGHDDGGDDRKGYDHKGDDHHADRQSRVCHS